MPVLKVPGRNVDLRGKGENRMILALIIGMFVGAFIGAGIMAILYYGRSNDE